MNKPILWLLLSDLSREDVHLAIPTIAWMAKKSNVLFESYLECERKGLLFSATGSTVIGGHHHQQFNYLNSIFEVKYIILGETLVFNSSIEIFKAEIIAKDDSLVNLYRKVLAYCKIKMRHDVMFACNKEVEINKKKIQIGPYLFPEIYYRKALAFPASTAKDVSKYFKFKKAFAIYLSSLETEGLLHGGKKILSIDIIAKNDNYGSITLRIAKRWAHKAKGVAFGDPPAILSQLAEHCHKSRIAVFGERESIPPSKVVVSAYTEATTSIIKEVVKLARKTGNNILIGRQTGDGDLFEWSKSGICVQIIDPNRPPFPVVSEISHCWHKRKTNAIDAEPNDKTLLNYAKEGKRLATLLWHSGEVAHNEAMLNLFDLAAFTGIKMGIGVHAARYETCPQFWELLNIPKEKGGVLGLIEPIIYSGGMGILAENNCPAHILKNYCGKALQKINKITGGQVIPKGYHAFMDSDLKTLTQINKPAFSAVKKSGLEYFISSARPGRNEILYQSGNFIAINQSCRVIHAASPFVRITTAEDLETAGWLSPGWMIGTFDAPVIAFNPYIWRHGSRFMQLIDNIKSNYINVTPNTIARYARILKENGFIK